MTDATKATTAKPVPRSITMADGRVVEFPAKRRKLSHGEYKDGAVHIRMDWENGQTLRFTQSASGLTGVAALAIVHGFEQKLGDESAGVEKIDDAIEGTRQLITRLQAGDWNTKADPNSLAGAGLLVRAMARAFPEQPVEAARTFVGTLTPKERTAMLGDERIAPHVKAIRAEDEGKAAKEVKTSDLLAKFGQPAAAPVSSVFAQGDAAAKAAEPVAHAAAKTVHKAK